jgi:hypothetical protein
VNAGITAGDTVQMLWFKERSDMDKLFCSATEEQQQQQQQQKLH